MESQTGINIETDIDYILACAMPAATGAEAQSSGLMLLRGRFDESKVQGALQKNGASLESYGGTQVVIVERPEAAAPAKRQAEPAEALGLAFLEPGLMAVGSVDLVHAAIDLKRGGSSVTSNPEMMEHVRSLDAGSVWAVGRLDALAPNGRLPLAFADQFPSITWFTLTGSVDAGMRGMLKAETRDEEAAARLRDIVRGLITVSKLQASASRPEMRAVLDSLELGGTGTIVALSFELPAVVLDQVTPDGGGLRGP